MDSVSTCGCKDANARLDECCIWECGAQLCTSEKTRCPGGQECGVAKECRSVRVCTVMDRWRSRAPKKMQREVPPHDYCTSTRRLRSRMYFPSLYFWDCSYALSCFNPRNGGKGDRSVSRTGEMGTEWNEKGKGQRSHISNRVWSCTCSNRCLARCGCLWSFDGHSVRLR
jgi:hypothetical protein